LFIYNFYNYRLYEAEKIKNVHSLERKKSLPRLLLFSRRLLLGFNEPRISFLIINAHAHTGSNLNYLAIKLLHFNKSKLQAHSGVMKERPRGRERKKCALLQFNFSSFLFAQIFAFE
jgi:hypothetical protein